MRASIAQDSATSSVFQVFLPKQPVHTSTCMVPGLILHSTEMHSCYLNDRLTAWYKGKVTSQKHVRVTVYISLSIGRFPINRDFESKMCTHAHQSRREQDSLQVSIKVI